MTQKNSGFSKLLTVIDVMKTDLFDTAARIEGIVEDVTAPGERLARKIGHYVPLDAAERAALNTVLMRNLRRIGDRAPLIDKGAAPNEIHVIIDGWACRYAMLSDGRRRIVAFYLPGDICDFDVFLMPTMDQAIAAIGTVQVAGINRSMLNDLSHTQPRISRGLWWESLTAAAIQRAWTINVGHRAAKRRLAHLLCELHQRLSLVGLTDGGRCVLPLTQGELGDACAMTAIHTNRALQEIRREGLLSLADTILTVHDWEALKSMADFDPAYLQVPMLCEEDAVASAVIVV